VEVCCTCPSRDKEHDEKLAGFKQERENTGNTKKIMMGNDEKSRLNDSCHMWHSRHGPGENCRTLASNNPGL